MVKINNYFQLTQTNASSKNFHRRGVAPVIATLLLVAIAVVGGSIIFVFAQGFFSTSQVSGTPAIEFIKIIGYDARDESPLKAHDGIDMIPANCCGEPDSVKSASERIVIYLQKTIYKPLEFVLTKIQKRISCFGSFVQMTDKCSDTIIHTLACFHRSFMKICLES